MGARVSGSGTRWAAALIAGALLLPAAAGGAARVSLELSCSAGLVDLEARAVPAAEVFRALERGCPMVLVRPELLPAAPVTFSCRGRSLEQVVAELVRLAGVPSTLAATGPGVPLTLVLLPTGRDGPAGGTGAPGRPGEGEPAQGRRAEAQGTPQPETQSGLSRAILEELGTIDPDQAWVLTHMEPGELLAERDEAAAEDLLRSFLAAEDGREREQILAALNALGPSPVTGRPWTAADVADERWRLAWEGARRACLLAGDDAARAAAMDLLRRENDAEAEYLEGLPEEDLERERLLERSALLRERFLLARGRAEWERALAASPVPGAPAAE